VRCSRPGESRPARGERAGAGGARRRGVGAPARGGRAGAGWARRRGVSAPLVALGRVAARRRESGGGAGCETVQTAHAEACWPAVLYLAGVPAT